MEPSINYPGIALKGYRIKKMRPGRVLVLGIPWNKYTVGPKISTCKSKKAAHAFMGTVVAKGLL